MRLFVAICLNEAMKAALSDCAGQLKRQCSTANFTRVENLHLTLAFIGETDRPDRAQSAIEQLSFGSFDMTLSHAGHFGDLWWVGIRENHALSALAVQVQHALRAQGFSIERRRFSPHITIARQVVSSAPIVLAPPRASMRVDRIALMQSTRCAGKLIYTQLYTHLLEKRPGC